ncbi:hypothetical protein HYH02_012652 [Chlamydomonas schloesseri]|uniref:Uncharacterized protein n=1 Tax=Chlamydomonas schloesseri TaxID=2026947 RepID=A0A835T473_9CHLO|nr:hypothetical protein HYH02_012652 [Chlamydomonas schloesseri]|eukprot:KAG2433534.1 hypothetical protein HYH02_012652 [Chlamydomonas schloesseri]
MAEDYRETFKEIENKKALPEFNLAECMKSLDSLADPVKEIEKIAQARRKRAAEAARQKEANARLQEQFAADREKTEAEAAALAQDVDEPMEDVGGQRDEEVEPPSLEPLCLTPQQPLPAVDVSPLQLPLASAEGELLLQQLLATRQLFDFLGAFTPDTATPVLRVLWQLVCYGEQPYAAYQQAVEYYRSTPRSEMGWIPQVLDFHEFFVATGFLPSHGHGHGGRGSSGGSGSRKRSAGQVDAGEQGAAGGGAGPSGSGAVVAGTSAAGRIPNLQCLLRLLVELVGLQIAGRLDMGFDNAAQGAGKSLLQVLLRLLLDPDMCAALYCEARAAVEAAMAPWEERLWRRVGDDAAVQALELGPSPRATWRLLAALPGSSERLRGWRTAVAMNLLRKVVPHNLPWNKGGAALASRRGASAASELQALLGPESTPTAARAVVEALKRSKDRKVDYWRLMTILQCVQLVAWDVVYTSDHEESANLYTYIYQYMNSFEQHLRGREALVMRIRVFLAEGKAALDSSSGHGNE